jgi:hypothetical protein
MNAARSLILTTLASVCALVGLVAASAQATTTHRYLSQITEVPAGAGVALPGKLSAPSSMTVDSGHLWVTEAIEGTAQFRVDQFNAATAAFISQPLHVAPYPPEYLGLAVGQSAGEPEPDLYVAEYNGGAAVGVYGESGTKLGAWSGAETPAKSFGVISHVAADNSQSLTDWAAGDVYVSDPEHGVVDVFKPAAGGKEKYVAQLTGPGPGEAFTNLGQVAVNAANGDVLVVDGAAVDVFEPTVLGEYLLVRQLTGTPSGAFQTLGGVAVDSGEGEHSGDIYVLEVNSSVIDQFTSAGVYLGHLIETPSGPFGGLESLAVDPATHDLYVGGKEPGSGAEEGGFIDVFGASITMPDVVTGAPTNLRGKSATLNGTVNPDEAGEATCQFDWGTSPSFGQVAPCSEAVADGGSPVAVHAALSDLQPDTTYYYRLQATGRASAATNPGEPSQDQQFTTPGAGIDQQAAAAVTSESATLDATINPHNALTTYYFQYGTSASYGADVPAPPGASIGAGEGDQSLSVHLQGLAPGTTYHFRVIAISAPGGEAVTTEGADETFTTQASGSEFTLPDGRAWEMVTPPDKHGAGLTALGNEQGADIQAAEDGSAITFAATAPFASNPAGSRAVEVTQVYSNRNAPGSWETQDITTAHTEGASEFAVGHSAEYKLFSSNLSLGAVEPAGHTPLPPLPPGSEKTIYLRTENGEYKALVTAANVPPGTIFGGNEGQGGGVAFAGASPDFSHVVVSSQLGAPILTPNGPEGGLYMWADGHLQPISVLPSGGPAAARLGNLGENVRHAVSNDGSRVVWEAGGNDYLRDMSREETVELNPHERSSQGAHYADADSEDSRVFFTSLRPRGEDLYEFEVTSGTGEPLAGKLTDLTVDTANGNEGAAVQGVIGASEDGSDVYFVANGLLGDGPEHGAKSGDCGPAGKPQTQTCNLYVEHYDAGSKAWTPPSFIATLSGADSPVWGEGPPTVNDDHAHMISRVSPNGRYLAFMSERSLTGYENRDATSGVPDEEVFLYDATAGRLVCASCDPTGARPAGLFEGSGFEENLVDYAKTWEGRWVAANIPGWDPADLSSALYQTRYLSNSGRLFFNSSDALVPADVNGKEDVYEYEPAEVGSCQGTGHGQGGSVVFSSGAGGCVGLISEGTSPEESAFLDASATGGDVFFLTTSRLAAQDRDTSIDLYDAHECTVASPCAPSAALVPPPCTTGDACKPAPTPQPAIFGAPSSETFSGAGNLPAAAESAVTPRSVARAQKLAQALKACGKKPKRKRAACRSQARKRYGAKKPRVKKSLSAGVGR